MHLTIDTFAYLVVPMPFLVLGACSSSGVGSTPSDGGCRPYVSDAALSAASSFGVDVLPVFEQSCAVNRGLCHGAASTYPYLGSTDGGVDAATVLANIVDVPSGEDPMMSFVARTDPTHSYLMHKIDGDQCTLAAECDPSFPNCGHTMPFSGPMLSEDARDKVRSWIRQGALNN
jgi:hypothetical protein